MSEQVSVRTGRRFTVKTKMLAMNILVVLIMIAMTVYAILSANNIDTQYSSLLQRQKTMLTDTLTAPYYAAHEVSLLREYFLLNAPGDMSTIQQNNQQIQVLLQHALSLAKSSSTRAQLQKALTDQENFYSQVQQIASMPNNKHTLQIALKENLMENGVNISTDLQTATKSTSANIQANANAQSAAAVRATSILIIAAIIAVIVSILLGLLLANIISRPLMRLVEVVGKVAHGDLRELSDVKSRDEVGEVSESVNDMIMRLRKIMSGVLSAAGNVAAASQEISAATEQIASGSTTQAESAEMANHLFKELSTAINEVAKNAEDASALSAKTAEVATQGKSIVQSSVEGMDKVREQIALLSQDSSRVGEILAVIDDIADQTNLLALNAAIEAARAGEQGRGFAVVADEVRKLAERSSDATKQITTIIKTMQANTEASVQAVQKGVASTQESGEAFTQIASMVSASADRVTEIAAASEEQSAQTSEVLVAIETIASAAEESAASSEETASSAQTLAQLADELNGYVSVFKIS